MRIADEDSVMSMADEYVEAVWKYMIGAGGAVPKKLGYGDENYSHAFERDRLGSYYGSEIRVDFEMTRDVLRRLQRGARPVWDKMLPPDDGIEHRFNHTFTTSSLEIAYFEGELILDDGSTHQWVMESEFTDFSFSGSLRRIIEISRRDFEDSIKSLQRRIDSYGSSYDGLRTGWME